MNILIPMAGAGSRFANQGIDIPKPLIPVLGKTLIEHSIDSFDVEGKFIFITREFEASQNKKLSDLLKKRRPESVEIRVQTLTSGATETALLALDYINNDEPLVIYNCDQRINWNPQDFLKFIKENDPAAALILYKSKDPKNSFAEIKNSLVTRVIEKDPISEHALIGFHYWKRGKDFVNSAQQLINSFRKNGSPECYVSETFNFLIDLNYKVFPYHVSRNVYVPLGTPEDVSRYVGKVKEFNSFKSKTLIIDIDGTILKHRHSISSVYETVPELLPGVREKIDAWDCQGHRIIFMTARKESSREITEAQLRKFGLAWDQLIMGVGNGERILVNDKLDREDSNRAIAINIVTDDGFNSISWEDYDL